MTPYQEFLLKLVLIRRFYYLLLGWPEDFKGCPFPMISDENGDKAFYYSACQRDRWRSTHPDGTPKATKTYMGDNSVSLALHDVVRKGQVVGSTSATGLYVVYTHPAVERYLKLRDELAMGCRF